MNSGTTSDAGMDAVRSAEDLRLVSAVLRKDRKATAEFVERYADTVYGYISRRLAPRRDLVDDLVQAVFLEAWDALPRFRGDSPVRNWLLGIARHKVQEHYRQRVRSVEISVEDRDFPDTAELPGFDQALLRVQARAHIQAVLDQLPEVYRLVLVWRYWDKMSAQEMAAQTGRTEKAIERLLARARDQFKRSYSERAFGR